MSLDSVQSLLSSFHPITLQEMDSVKLLDRTDTKYAFSSRDLSEIIKALLPDYFVLEVSGNRSTNYETLYFDTPDFTFYLHHHNQKMNRVKARFRRYVESGLVFFEVKFKSNKDRTNKNRIRRDEIKHTITGQEQELYETISGSPAIDLVPKMWVNYNRITFVSRTLTERLTIDTGLTFIEKSDELITNQHTFGGLVIAEVKQQKVSFTSPFIRLMARHHVRQLSISKYCLGVATLHKEIKQNNFKEKLLTVKKIVHGFN